MFLGGSLSTYHFFKNTSFAFALRPVSFLNIGYFARVTEATMLSLPWSQSQIELEMVGYSHWWSIFLGRWN